MKKVCFISLGSYPLFNPSIDRTFGGAEVQIYLLSKELSSVYDVSVLVGDFGQPDIELVDGVKVVKGVFPERENPIKMIMKGVAFFKILKLIDADVYVQRAANGGMGIIAFFCRLFRRRFIYMTAHEMDCSGDFERESSFITSMLFRFGILNAHSIVTQCVEHKKMLEETYSLKSVVVKSMHKIDSPSHGQLIQKNNYLWVGRCEKWKKPELMIKLASMNPELSFVMVCPPVNGKEAYYSHIEKLATEVDNLQFIDFVPFDEIGGYFKRALMFINTSLQEGFPNTYVQSFVSATPVISLSVDPDRLLSKEDIGYCANGDENLFFSKFEMMSGDRALLGALGGRAYKYAKRNHDITGASEVFSKIL